MNDKEPMDAELVNPQALAVVAKQPVGLFGDIEPKDVIVKAAEVATALKDVVIKQGLVSNISGKQYPRCEAWTLLGTMLGVFPVMVWTRKLEDGWEARVAAKTKDGSVVGAAEAQCLRSERNWKDRDDFALRSMAQTRATAKCLRMPLGFVMTLSGFEATPAEEMVSDRPAVAPKGGNPPPPIHVPQRVQMPTPATRNWMLNELNALHQGDPGFKLVVKYFQKVGHLLPTEILGDLPLRFVPATRKELEQLVSCIANFEAGGDAVAAFEPHGEADAPPKESQGKSTGATNTTSRSTQTAGASAAPCENVDKPGDQDAWRAFPMPFGKNAGVPMGELEKNYLFGLWANYTVETEYRGRPKKPETIAKDQAFRAMLDLAGKHYEFKKKD